MYRVPPTVCYDNCQTTHRKKNARKKRSTTKEENVWLSDYQRNYNRPAPRGAPPVAAWAKYYNAQLQQRAASNVNWSVGAGDCGAQQKEQHAYSNNGPYYNSYNNHSGAPPCSQIYATQNAPAGKSACSQSKRQQHSHLPQPRQGCPGVVLFQEGDVCNPCKPTPCCKFTGVKRIRTHMKDIKSKTDSGLNRGCSTSRHWYRDTTETPSAFVCQPWQIQKAQILLEERGDVSHYYSQCRTC